MGENACGVTPGTGIDLHTFQRTVTGPGTVDEQVVIDGEPTGATYTVTTAATSIATANSHVLEIMAGADLPVRLDRLQVYQAGLATAAAMGTFNIFRLDSAGDTGVAYTPRPMDKTDAAAGATALAIPTNKGTEDETLWGGSANLIQTAGVSVPNLPLFDIDFTSPRLKPIIIPAGAANGICFKNITAVAAGTVIITCWLKELSY